MVGQQRGRVIGSRAHLALRPAVYAGTVATALGVGERCIPVNLLAAAPKPLQVRAAVTGLLDGDAVLVDEVLRGVGRRSEHGGAESPDERLRVAFVPGRGEDDDRFAFWREGKELVRHGQRIE